MPTRIVSSQSISCLPGEVESINKIRYQTLSHCGWQFYRPSGFVKILPRQSIINALSLDSVSLGVRKIKVCAYNEDFIKNCVSFESSSRIHSLEKELVEIDDSDGDSLLSKLMPKAIDRARKKNNAKILQRSYGIETKCKYSRERVVLNFTPTFIQKGCTCKLAALANVNDYYFMNGLTDRWVPANKKIHPRLTSFPDSISAVKIIQIESSVENNSELIKNKYHEHSCLPLSIGDIGEILRNEILYLKEVKVFLLLARIRLHQKNNPKDSSSSIRQYAKSLGSVQGEVVSPEMLSNIGKLISLKSKMVKCDDFDMFRNIAVEEINNNHPVMTFTQGFPHKEAHDRTTAQWEEHAIVLIGYRWGEETFIYTESGSQKEIAAEKLWHLMSSVPEKREKEFFLKVEPNAKDVSFCSDVNSGQVQLSDRWYDCQQVMDQTGCYPRVNKTVYFEYDDAGKMILDRDALDKIDLTHIKGIRKSVLPLAEDSNFVRVLMVFTPEGNT